MSVGEVPRVGAVTDPSTQQDFPDLVRVLNSDVEPLIAFPNLTRRILAYNDKLMVVEHVMEEGSVFPRHVHPHEQLAYLISGHIQVMVGDYEPFEAKAGDSFVVRGGVEHQVVALKRSIALDVFTPYREDFIEWLEQNS
jgi:quercetin dioxygenase-like cupin family protein